MPEYSLVRNCLDQIHANGDFSDDETDEYQAYFAQKTLKQKPTTPSIGGSTRQRNDPAD
jgi:hypothetical protein